MSNFHIHVDAIELAPEFERFLVDGCRFYRSDFAGHPEGVEGFEPPHHLTLKVRDGNEFRDRFEQVVAQAGHSAHMRGYVEGEFIAADLDIEERAFDAEAAAPLRIEKAQLKPGHFRESEIHITLDRDRSDPRLLQALTHMGFFAAYIPKPYGIAEIFTAQGSRSDVDRLMPAVVDFLKTAGGAVACTVKEERVAAWWVSDPGVHLPPVIGRLQPL
ncbi:MAG TPA: hypothetical protein VGS58_09075 [Candidatus Sulfopaludibacter sp.]|nr:hypothetical protein [Candidatus Sulfopaludibacter sp.]